MKQAFPYLLLPVVLVRAQPRAPARARRRGPRRPLRRHRPAGGRGHLRGRLLAHLAAARLRGAGRLPAAAGAELAVPDLPLLPRLQRPGHRPFDVLPLRGPAPAARRARAAGAPVLLAFRQDARPVLLDGAHLPGSGAAGDRARPLRPGRLLRRRGADAGPLRDGARGAGLDGHARAREHLPRSPGPRPADADGAALRDGARGAAARAAPGAAALASSRFPT